MSDRNASKPGVLLDVDGTLVDSTYLHALAWWRAITHAGEEVAFFRIHRLIGMGADKLLEALLGEFREDLDEAYSKEFAEIKDEATRFPRVPELLSELSGRGAKVVLATSARPDHVGHLTDLIGAEESIDEVVHSGDVEESKPSPDIFRSALEKGRLEPSSTLAVGDSVWDVQSAGRCGVRCIGLLTGGVSRAELSEAGAVAVYEDPADLLDNLDGSPIGKLLS